MDDKELQKELENAADAAVKEMERWRNIATMMSHFSVCNLKPAECKTCKIARRVYMEAQAEHAEIDKKAFEMLIEQGHLK